MERKTFKKSLLVVAIMAIMLFAMTITASAASGASNVKQTGSSTSSVNIEWTSNYGEKYQIFVSQTRGGTYYATSNYTQSSNSEHIYNLSAGRSYYVCVKTYNSNGVQIAVTEPIEVVTSPSTVSESTIKQTGGSNSAVALKWTAVSGATGYKIQKYESGSSSLIKSYITSKATARISAGAGYRYYVKIYSYRKSSTGYVAWSSSYGYKYSIYSAPKAPMHVANADYGNFKWKPSEGNSLTIGWDYNSNYYMPDGYQVQVYSVDGKTRLYTTQPTTSSSVKITSAKFRKAINAKGCRIRVRSYKNTSEGLSWSPFKVIVPQAKITGGTALSKTSAKVTWAKVQNAQYYVVYYSTKVSGSIKLTDLTKKVKVSANTTSYTIKGLTAWQDFGVCVIPVVKVNGKTYRGTACEYYKAYVY